MIRVNASIWGLLSIKSGELDITVYSRYSGHIYSGHSDIVSTFPGTKYIYSLISRSDIVANRI